MTFDDNSKENYVFFKKIHLRPAARAVSLCLLSFVFVDLFFSFHRSTAAMFYSWMSACFSIGIYGALVYAVFKEKRTFMLPYLVFQTVFVIFLTIMLMVFIIAALFSNEMLFKVSTDVGAVDVETEPAKQIKQFRSFVLFAFLFMTLALGIETYFLEIIFRFFHFLKERETSFNFNMDNDFQLNE